MSNWITLDMSDVDLFQDIKTLLDTVSPILNSLIIGLETASTVLDVLIKILELISSVDPTDVITSGLSSLLNSLSAGKVHVLMLKPIETVDPVGYIYRTVQESLYDVSDPNRPVFDIGAICGGFVMFASSPTISGISQIVETFKLLINTSYSELQGYIAAINDFYYPSKIVVETGTITGFEIEDRKIHFIDTSKIPLKEGMDIYSGGVIEFLEGYNVNKFVKIETYDYNRGLFRFTKSTPFDLKEGDTYLINLGRTSGAPDWEKMDISSLIPILGPINKTLSQIINTIQGTPSLGKISGKIAKNIQKKIALLNGVLSIVNNLKSNIDDFLKVNNINILPIEPLALGTSGFVRTIYESDNKPQTADKVYMVGAVVCGAEPLYPVIKLLFGI